MKFKIKNKHKTIYLGQTKSAVNHLVIKVETIFFGEGGLVMMASSVMFYALDSWGSSLKVAGAENLMQSPGEMIQH